jgi:hypothetical protein
MDMGLYGLYGFLWVFIWFFKCFMCQHVGFYIFMSYGYSMGIKCGFNRYVSIESVGLIHI